MDAFLFGNSVFVVLAIFVCALLGLFNILIFLAGFEEVLRRLVELFEVGRQILVFCVLFFVSQ